MTRIPTALAILFVVVAIVFVLMSFRHETFTLSLAADRLTSPSVQVDESRKIGLATLPSYRSEIDVVGRTLPGSTVTITLNDVVEGTAYVPPGSTEFSFYHVPMPSTQVSLLRIDASKWHVTTLVRAEPLRYAIVNPAPRTAAVLLDVLRSDTSGNAVVRGTGPPSAALIVYDSMQGAPKVPFPAAQVRERLRIDPDGNINAPIWLPPGIHRVWGATPDCYVLACASAVTTLEVDASSPPPGELRPDRSLTFEVGYKRLAAELKATLSRQDVVAKQIVEGQHGDVILEALYGRLLLNDAPVSTLFNGTVATYQLTADTIQVTIRSERQRPADTTLPTLAGRVVIVDPPDAGPGRDWRRDSVAVKLRDYTLSQPQPSPERTETDGSVSWERPFGRDGGRVAMTLSFVPWSSVESLRAFLGLSAFAYVPSAAARFVAFAGGLTFAIPMLVYLGMTRVGGKSPLTAAARLLTAICVAPDVFLALSTSEPDFNDALSWLFPAWNQAVVVDLLSPLLSTTTMCVAASTIAVLLAGNAHRFWIAVLRECALAIAFATLIFAPSAAATFAVHTGFRMNAAQGFVYLVAMTLIIGSVSTAALAPCGFYHDAKGRVAWRIVGLAAVIALVTAIPVAFNRYIVWASSAALGATVLSDAGSPAGLMLDYFRQAGVLCNFSFGLALIATAFLPSGGNGLNRPRLLRLALCCYAVASTVSIFMVPVTFVLAWRTFPVLLGRGEISRRCMRAIRRSRARSITELFFWPKTDDLASRMEELVGKHADGDVSDQQFALRRAQLQRLLDKRMPPEVEYAFGVAPYASARQNGAVGLAVAGAFVFAHLLLFLATETAALRVQHSAYTLLVIVAYLATGIAQFVVPAFVFGACFDLIAGRSALQKAIRVAAWAIVCSLPSWLVALPSLISVVALIVETALFYTVLGFVYDAVILRESRSIPFRIRDVPKLSGVPALSWAGTIAVAALGIGISGALSGQLQNVATSTITSVYHQATFGQ